MAAHLQHMSLEEIAQSNKTARLEQAYDRALQQAERIYEEERARALRVQLLLLEDENDDLHEQIEDNEIDLNRLEDGNDELRQRLSELESDLQASQTDLKARLRDLDHLKTEVNALNATNSDSTKFYSEKLTLARELAVLKPELLHLKSQASTQQNLLAEKLALQRELNAIQVELETEKRAVQRIKAQDKSNGAVDSALAADIEELKKELAKEKRDAQKNDRESRKKTTEWESQKEGMESKLDAFRTKLRTTKEQLKEAQDDLEKAQAAKFAQSAELTKARLTGANPKKRSVARFDPDMTIGTPGHGHGTKKQKTSIMPGDKSTFSITPFLNRTLSILPESPAQADKDDFEKVDAMINKQIDAIAAEAEHEAQENLPEPSQPAAKKTTALGQSKTQPLKEKANSKSGTTAQKPRLAKVAEEVDEEADQENAESNDQPSALPVLEPQKKLKMLGQRKSIFDDDEESGKAKSFMPAGLRGGGTSFGKISLAGLGKGKSKMLTEFSPLKKDRRPAMALV